MANKSHEDASGQLAATIEVLNEIRNKRIAALTADMGVIRTSIRNFTGLEWRYLKEPLDFDAIIEWSSEGSGVKLFLGGDYELGTVIKVESSRAQEPNKPMTEILKITVNPTDALSARSLTVIADESIRFETDVIPKNIPDRVRLGMHRMQNYPEHAPESAFHQIALAQDVVRFARQALLQEVTAINNRIRESEAARNLLRPN